jgi:hypothetical protein
MDVSGEKPRWATRIASGGIGILFVVAVSLFQDVRPHATMRGSTRESLDKDV